MYVAVTLAWFVVPLVVFVAQVVHGHLLSSSQNFAEIVHDLGVVFVLSIFIAFLWPLSLLYFIFVFIACFVYGEELLIGAP